MIRRSAVLVVLVSLFAVVNTLNNVIDAPSGFDWDWDESDARQS